MAEAAADLPDTVIALFDAGLAPVSISRAIASIHDAVTRRMIEFAHQDLGRPPVPYTWMATGSFGRFEPFPSSDVDSAIAWEGPDDDPEIRRAIAALAEHVLEGLGKCGFEPDTKGAVASNPLFARSVEEWERAARTWIEHPDRDRGLLLLSVVVESDAVWGSTAMADHLAAGVRGRLPTASCCCGGWPRPRWRSARPPGSCATSCSTRAASARACSTSSAAGCSPSSRWRAGAVCAPASARPPRGPASGRRCEAGTLSPDDATNLRDAFELFSALRMEHQVGQLREGADPDDLIEPKSLAPLARTSLKEAFRAVARVQRGVGQRVRLPAPLTPRAKRLVARGAVHRDRRRDDRARPAARRGHLVRRHPDRVRPDHRVGVGSRPRTSPGHVHERGRRDPPLARGGPRRGTESAGGARTAGRTDARADPGGACQLGGAHISRARPGAPCRAGSWTRRFCGGC